MHITIPGEPVAQGRGRACVVGGHARVYDPKKSRNWKATAQQHMAAALNGRGPIPAGTPIQVQVVAYFTCPKSDHRKRVPRPRRWHTKRPDADNVLKAVKDAGSGVLWIDDRQVVDARALKVIAAQNEAPRVEIRVEVMEALEERRCG